MADNSNPYSSPQSVPADPGWTSWYMIVMKKYAVFEGRARRKEYWMFFLCNFLIGIVLGVIEQATGLQGILSNIYNLAVFIPSIAVGIRRMHDSDHSGWWFIVPIAGLIFLFYDGTRGENRFGPDPKEAPAPA
jgi:uncharacterized membrane protein YhaH (DUF805 family)